MSFNRVILWLSLSDLKWNILSSDWQQAPSTQLAKCALQPKWILLMYLMPCCVLKLPTPPYSCCPDHNSHRHLNGAYLDSVQISQFCLILWSHKTMLMIPKAIPSHCLSLWSGGQPVGSQNVALSLLFFWDKEGWFSGRPLWLGLVLPRGTVAKIIQEKSRWKYCNDNRIPGVSEHFMLSYTFKSLYFFLSPFLN